MDHIFFKVVSLCSRNLAEAIGKLYIDLSRRTIGGISASNNPDSLRMYIHWCLGISPYKNAEFTSADSNSKSSAAATAKSNLTDYDITVPA